MNCLSCRFENREDARFCINCGEELKKTCPHCGRVLPSAARFCDMCGSGLTAVTPSANQARLQAQANAACGGVEEAAEGERKIISVLFADTVNFTGMSERLDPEEIHQIMDPCLSLLAGIISRHQGTVTQFTGDGIMALFGAPFAREDHAQRACHAAIEMQRALVTYGAEVRNRHGQDFAMRIGINSGLAIVGSIGKAEHTEYTALGDTANLAARLQTLAPPGSIVVSRSTYRLCEQLFPFRALGEVRVKGKTRHVEAYELPVPGSGLPEPVIAPVAVRTPFVGRKREVALIKRLLRRVEAGSGQVVAIVGEAGVGKSRLLSEATKEIDPDLWYRVEGRCIHFGAAVAFLPLLQIVRALLGLHEGQPEGAAIAALKTGLKDLPGIKERVTAPLLELLSLTAEDEAYRRLEPKQKRERTFEALRELLLGFSLSRNLLLAVEDVHWIDKTSEEFLSYLMPSLKNRSILLALLYRPEYHHEWTNRPFYTGITLDHLEQRARTELLEAIVVKRDFPREVIDLVAQKAGGNPLFIEEFAHTLAQSYEGGDGKVGELLNPETGQLRIPDTIHGIIAARVDGLERPVKQTIQLASVVGRDFSYPLLERVTNGKDQLKGHLRDLEGREFIYERSVYPEPIYAFRHALVREVAYDGLLYKKRRELHGIVGRAIEDLYPDRLEEFYEILAHHYARSDNDEKAYAYLRAAALKAAQTHSLWEAFHFFQQAIRTVDKWPSSDRKKEEQMAIRLLAASSMISLGFPAESLQVLLEGERLAREKGDTKAVVTFCSIIGLFYSVKGNPLTGVKYGEECLSLARHAGDLDLLAPTTFDLCSNYAARGLFTKVVDVAPPILELLEKEQKVSDCFGRGYNVYSALAGFCGFSQAYLGRFREGSRYCEKAVTAAADSQNLYSLGLAELLYGYLFCIEGDGLSAIPHFERSIEYLKKGHIFVLIGLAWSGLGWSHYYLGDTKSAQAHVEKGLQLHREAGISYDLSVHYWFLSSIFLEQGSLAKALDAANEAVRLARKMDEMYVLGIAMIVRGRILTAKGGGLQAAENSIQQGLALLDSLKIRTLAAFGHMALAELYVSKKRPEKAAREFRTTCAMLDEMGMGRLLEKTVSLASSLSLSAGTSK